ncbi:MAG: hypothetical protein ACFFCW_49185 [Candidatus Hodarchaeota archaeon]
MQNGRKMSLIDFLIRMGLWGGLGYVAGLRGSRLKGWSFLGPITEQVFGYSLEDVVAAMERERIKKEQEAAKANLAEGLRQIDFSAPKVNETGSLNSVLAVPPKQIPAYSKWRQVIIHPAIVAIFGGRGSGKSAAAYGILEDFRYSLSPYVVGFPEKSKGILPEWIGIARRLEDVPPGSIVIVDEAYLTHHAREWQKSGNRDICRLLNLSRQQDKTIVFIAQLGRQLDIDIVSSTDVLVLKNPGMLQPKFDRLEFRDLLLEARQAFQSVKGDIRRWSYVFSQNADFAGLIENDLPTFWNSRLSKAYANSGEMASTKLPKNMTREEKIARAKELHEVGWPLSKTANYFGVSKSTAFNWIRGYPYPKKNRLL